jgi:hypothetical protein
MQPLGASMHQTHVSDFWEWIHAARREGNLESAESSSIASDNAISDDDYEEPEDIRRTFIQLPPLEQIFPNGLPQRLIQELEAADNGGEFDEDFFPAFETMSEASTRSGVSSLDTESDSETGCVSDPSTSYEATKPSKRLLSLADAP